jgi:hypothetical protein
VAAADEGGLRAAEAGRALLFSRRVRLSSSPGACSRQATPVAGAREAPAKLGRLEAPMGHLPVTEVLAVMVVAVVAVAVVRAAFLLASLMSVLHRICPAGPSPEERLEAPALAVEPGAQERTLFRVRTRASLGSRVTRARSLGLALRRSFSSDGGTESGPSISDGE